MPIQSARIPFVPWDSAASTATVRQVSTASSYPETVLRQVAWASPWFGQPILMATLWGTVSWLADQHHRSSATCFGSKLHMSLLDAFLFYYIFQMIWTFLLPHQVALQLVGICHMIPSLEVTRPTRILVTTTTRVFFKTSTLRTLSSHRRLRMETTNSMRETFLQLVMDPTFRTISTCTKGVELSVQQQEEVCSKVRRHQTLYTLGNVRLLDGHFLVSAPMLHVKQVFVPIRNTWTFFDSFCFS